MLNDQGFKTIFDLFKRFPDEKSCHQYLASRKWSDGVITCPHEGCGCEEAYVFSDGIRYKCKKCRKKFTVRNGTIFEASNLPLLKWFTAMFLITHKKGISSVQLAKDIGTTQRTAWFLMHRIRHALGMDTPKESMSGTVEIDESFVGGKNKNRHYSKRVKYKETTGRSYPDKIPVFGMYHRETGKIRALVIGRRQLNNIARTITYNVTPGSTLMTDDWGGYKGLDKIYDRKSIDHKKWIYADGDTTTNRVENFWSHLKRGLHGTYIHVTPKHLNRYVQEFAFRFNHRNLAVQPQIDAIIRNMNCRLKYKELIA
jgi:transposase-like protein